MVYNIGFAILFCGVVIHTLIIQNENYQKYQLSENCFETTSFTLYKLFSVSFLDAFF